MDALHLLLNLAGLLLFFSWRGAVVAGTLGGALTIASTVKPAAARRAEGVLNLAALVVLLLLRAVLYWLLGRRAEWTAIWAPGPFGLSFRSDFLAPMVVFSVLSFGWMAWKCIGWLVLLAGLAPVRGEGDLVSATLRAQLGRVSRIPPWIALTATGLVTVAAWSGLSLALSAAGFLPAAGSFAYRLEQGLVVGGWLIVSFKWPLSALFVLSWLDSYIYLGKHSVWDFVHDAAHTALKPLRWAHVGRLDLAPVIGTALVWGFATGGEKLLGNLHPALPWHGR